jgi:hypothetical protein
MKCVICGEETSKGRCPFAENPMHDVAKDIGAANVRGHMVHYQCALLCGYNELAKLGQTLGEKVYFRLRRDAAHEELARLGHHVEMIEDEAVLVLNDRPPHIRFTAADIELMRKCVAEHDAKGGAS